MKKNLLALAVAGATTAPMLAQADAALYGNMRPRLRPAQPTYWDWRAVSKQINRKRTQQVPK
ncbi:hypothetical protein [Marinobacterium stanieri]|uniref:hypothetical protein n=1 Tax=Marinobacterium stanieri TaxID=49186 RepID=UPI003A8D0DCE